MLAKVCFTPKRIVLRSVSIVLAPRAITSWYDNNKTYTWRIHSQHIPDTCGSDIIVEEECSKQPENSMFARVHTWSLINVAALNKTWMTPMDVLHIPLSLLQGVEISPVIVENPVKGLMTLVQSLLGHFTPLSSTDFFFKMQLQCQRATKSIKRILPSRLGHSLISAFLPSQQTCICCRCPALEHSTESEDTRAVVVSI